MPTGDFSQRLSLATRFDNAIVPLLKQSGMDVYPFGAPVLLNGASRVYALLRQLQSKRFPAALMMKFSPDYIIVPPNGKDPFFLDTKASVTPVFKDSHIETIANNCGITGLQRQDVGEVEREAWDSYNNFYSGQRTAICFAAPYHPKLIAIEWCSNIIPMYRIKEDTNLQSAGSRTPHINIHLGKMRAFADFLKEEFGADLSTDKEALFTEIKSWPLSKPPGFTVTWQLFKDVGYELKKTCPWLQVIIPNNINNNNLFDRLGL